MITFTNVKKKYENRYVINNINLKLPRYGMVIIEGPSGCGKTTLLNLLSGLIDFEGDINVDGHHINMMNQKQMAEYRLKNYGFIFQDFKLFENESVIKNIIFPLEAISSSSQETKIRKCNDLINLVGLKRNAKQKVNKLSGGEKQRVAIARALVNGPKIILADEPTGALDSKTAIEVMNILEKVSAKSLVIIVSHDDELAERYANQLIKMKDGKIESISYRHKELKEKYIPVSKLFFTSKKPSVPSSFLLSHTLSSVKQKKWRTSICNMVTSLGLIGIGLATSLSSSISANIKKSYSQIVDDSKITVTMKRNDQSIYGQYAASYYEVMDMAERYSDYIIDVGTTYYNDFESFFPQTNALCMADTIYYHQIPEMSARHINEFRWLDVEKPNTIYPEQIDELRDDQVVLSLTYPMVQDICFELKIERTVTSLSRYLQTNKLNVYFDFRNDNWEYSDQQLLEVVGFTLESQPGIYHTNHMWNEYMFEERMRFPVTDIISGESMYPWTLKKIYYFYTNDGRDEFIDLTRMDETFNPYILEIANEMYYPWLFSDISSQNIQRLLVFSNLLSNIPVNYFEHFQSISDEISNPIFGTYGGYSIYPSNMMFGFSSYMYFSGSEDSLIETVDINTSLNTETNEKLEIPSDVSSGHFSQSLTGGVNFALVGDSVDYGRLPLDYSEIVISSYLAKKVFQGDALNKTLYVAYLYSQSMSSSGNIIRHFKTTELSVCGIIDSDKNLIYHNMNWPISFFQIMFGVSSFNLSVNAMMFEVKDQKKIDEVITKLKRAFPDYEFSDPMNEINASVNQVCFYIEIALACFSIIAVIISTLLLSICNYLYVLENRKDIGLVRCIGINKNEARKFVITHSVVMCLISFVLSSIELLLMSVFISSELAKQMGTAFTFSFNYLSLVYMFALAFGISIISSLVISFKMNRLNPLEALKH